MLPAAGLLAVSVSYLLYSDFEREQELHRWISHTYEVLTQFHTLAAFIEKAEDIHRKYLLTGDPSLLGNFESAARTEESVRHSLMRLTSDNPGQQARIRALGSLVERLFVIDRELDKLRNTEGIPAVIAALQADRGKSIVDECRDALSAGEEEESGLLAERSAVAESQAVRTRWVLGVGTGSLLLLLVIAGTVIERDIMQRERDRSAMRRSEERLRLAMDSANAGIWEWDLRTNENVWSEELWKLYGLEPYSCTPSYEAWCQILHPDDRSNTEKAVGDAARSGVELNVEFRVRGDVGRERWLLARGRPLRDASGRPECFIGIALDITHRKRAEEILREREDNQRRFVEAAPVAIAMFDREMRYLAASQRYCEDYNLGSRELVGHSHYEIFPEIPESWREVHRRSLAGAVERSPGERFVRLDGSEQWVRWEIQPWRSGSGEIGGIVLFSEDISQQKRVEQALLDNEARLRLAQQIARIGTFERNFRTGIGAWTSELEVMHGLPPGGFDGNLQTWEKLVHPEDRAAALRQVALAMETGKFEGEWRVVWPDGTVRWLAARGSVLRDEKGELQRWLGVNIDITEAKEAEQALRRAHAELRESEHRFRQIFENAPTAIAIFAADGRLEKCNPAFSSLLGYTDEELRGASFVSFVPPEDLDTRLAELEQLRTGQAPFLQHDSRYLRKDGQLVWVHKFVTLLTNETGDEPRVLRLLTDITERKQADLEIRRLNTELEHRVSRRTAELLAANKELEAFSYSVSHDLRAPLRGIDGWSLALAEDYAGQLDERAQQYLGRIRSETQRMGLLIDDLLRLSRISSSELRTVPIDLTAMAREIETELCEANAGRRLEFTISSDLTASGDARLINIALVNLLANAVKFTEPREVARIEFGRTREGAFYIRDNGVGFDIAYADSLFRAFQRLHKASEFAGAGIGLAIVQRVIHRHSGEVWAEAQPDAGATFYFTLGNTT